MCGAPACSPASVASDRKTAVRMAVSARANSYGGRPTCDSLVATRRFSARRAATPLGSPRRYAPLLNSPHRPAVPRFAAQLTSAQLNATHRMKLHPFLECAERADQLIDKYGCEIFQQFNCT